MATSSFIEPIFENDEDAFQSGFAVPGEDRGPAVVAIDIGTTFSGYALSFKEDKFSIFAMSTTDPDRPQSGTRETKVPTTLLLKPDGSFHSFGHKAFEHYNRELDDSEQKTWYYFERFKMKLHVQKKLTKKTTVAAANGREMPVRTVFSHALRFFKRASIADCRKIFRAELRSSDTTWVITVPAIWDGGAKQIMREAAYEAGMSSESAPGKLLIALEPESASIYCKSLNSIGRTFADEALIESAFMVGSTYLLADLGGGTADITVHKVASTGRMKECHHATGGAWGGTYVDKEFINLLSSVFGKDVICKYEREYPGDWVDLVSKRFETSKRVISKTSMYVEFPLSFYEFLDKKGTSIGNCISCAKNFALKYVRGSLAITHDETLKLFKPVLDSIVSHLKLVITLVGGVDYIILVGGFATSELLQARIQSEFERQFNLRVIVPPASSLAVVMGAVLYGHDPSQIAARRALHSYGIEVNSPFDDQRDPLSSLYIDKKGRRKCSKRYSGFVTKNEEVEVGKKVKHTFYVSEDDQQSVFIPVFKTSTSAPRHTFDADRIASLTLSTPGFGEDRSLTVEMAFGETEVEVMAVDITSNETMKGGANLDFL